MILLFFLFCNEENNPKIFFIQILMNVLLNHAKMKLHALMGSMTTHATVYLDLREKIVILVIIISTNI